MQEKVNVIIIICYYMLCSHYYHADHPNYNYNFKPELDHAIVNV